MLSAPALDDVGAIVHACQDLELQRRVPIPVPYGREHARNYVTEYSDSGWARSSACTWAIRFDNQFTGVVGLDHIDAGQATIGYWMSPEHRGQGVVAEAVHAVLHFAFNQGPAGLGLDRVEWHAFSGNLASARVAQKTGFRFEGILRLGADGRAGREDDWVAGVLASDDRSPQPWPRLVERD